MISRTKSPPAPPAPRETPDARRSFRQSIVAMHRTIFKQNQARINRSVFGYTPQFQRYEREYAAGISKFERVATLEELDLALDHAQIVYVGDYHTLAQSQRAFLRVLRRLPEERPVVVALEFAEGRFQDILDAYMAGRIAERAFLRGINYDKHWVFGGWKNFKELLDLARERNYYVLAIDSVGRGPAGVSLQRRDTYAAKRIAQALQTHPAHLVAVLIGELHIAPSHLPAAVDRELKLEGFKVPRLILYQNCHELYFQLAEQGLEHEIEVLRLSDERYCLMNTPPIVCQQSFLNWLDVDTEPAQLEAPEANFKEFARLIASFFDLPIERGLKEVEIVTVADLSFLSRLQRRGDFSAADIKSIKKQILSSQSYYIPRAKTVYLGNLSVNHAAEEATHFIRHVVADLSEPRLLVDAFYHRCIEEALGFMGSKLINHKRKRASVEALQREARSRTASPAERHVARLVLRHLSMETGKKVHGISEVYGCDVDAFNAVTHILGYRLGDRLYYGLVSGQIRKAEVHNLFLDPMEEEGAALATYLYLLGRTAKVKVPERM
ncbi:MAG: ChaN family lipoprotein [Deltaproteobacteria bacterium]|nr:ChaN family lipoprotein [Deltaproteobacteria bacterium]